MSSAMKGWIHHGKAGWMTIETKSSFVYTSNGLGLGLAGMVDSMIWIICWADGRWLGSLFKQALTMSLTI